MPIYEYECRKCGHHLEAFQRFSDAPLTHCEKCRGKLKKLISQSTFHLKGTGWYVTDYAPKSGGNQAKESTSETKPSSGGADDTKKTAPAKDASPKKPSKADA